MFDKLNIAELPALDWIQEHMGCAFLDAVMPVVTFFGDSWFVIPVAVIMLFFRKTRKTGLMIGLALIFGLLVCNLTVKPLMGRIRPYELSGFDILIGPQSDRSFPSGHTTASFELATVLMIRDKRFGIPALAMAFVIAFSRLYLYVHYPTDILGGIVIGVTCGVLGWFVLGKLWHMVGQKKGFPDELK